MSEIDYTKLGEETARAALYVHDTEADRLISEMPDSLRDFYAGRVPARGTVPGEQRLAKVQSFLPMIANRVAAQAEREALEARARQRTAVEAEERDARRTLGGYSGPLPDNWREWVSYVKDGGKVSEFTKQVVLNRPSAPASQHPIRIF